MEDRERYGVWQPPSGDDPILKSECPGSVREPYRRNFIVLPDKPRYDIVWWPAVSLAAQVRNFAMGTSPDDAGVGDPGEKYCHAINPGEIGDGLSQVWFDFHYPGTIMEEIGAGTPYEAAVKLLPERVGDIAQEQRVWDMDYGEQPGGGTIRNYGCLLTACSIILRKLYGKEVSPPWLDKLFVIARMVYVDDNTLIFEGFVEMFPIFDDVLRVDGAQGSDYLASLLADNWEVVLRSGTRYTHFVYLESVEMDGLHIIDTYDGQRKIWTPSQVSGVRAAHVIPTFRIQE